MLMVLTCILMMPTGADESPDARLAQSILIAHNANRAKFTHWTIRYKFTVGRAADLESAIAGRWTETTAFWKGPAVGEGFSAFDGKRGLYEELFSLKDLAEKRTLVGPNGQYSSYFSADRDLTDGEVTFHDGISADKEGKALVHNAQIYAGKEIFHNSLFLPLDLGRLPGHETDRFSANIQAVSERKPGHALQVREGVRLFDRDLTELTFIDTSRSQWVQTDRYWIDVEEGAIIRKFQRTSKVMDELEYVDFCVQDDVRRVGGAAWFPYRRLTYSHYDGVVRDRVITEAEFAKIPPQSTFRLTFDEPMSVPDQARSVSYPARKVWDLEDLPAPESQPKPLRWPGVMDSLASNWQTIVAIVLVIIPSVMAVRLFRRRGHDV